MSEMIGSLEIMSPKRRGSARSEWDGFFPYYAGYPVDFAHKILRSAALSKDARVFDPWNGSGSTTFAAAQLGLNSSAFDLNPAMIVVARARLLPPSEADSLEPLAKKLTEAIRPTNSILLDCDPLLRWFDDPTAAILRSLEREIFEQLVGSLTSQSGRTNWGCLSGLASTFYVALFSVCRNFTRQFQSSNPTWLRYPKFSEEKASAGRSEISQSFVNALSQMATALLKRTSEVDGETAKVTLRCADTAESSPRSKSIDFVLTSPPYCTRIDYSAATRIELSVLSPLLNLSDEELRRTLIGSTLSPKHEIKIRHSWGNRCIQFLDALSKHPSKSSKGYYLKTHLDYFDKIYQSISNISNCMKDYGTAILVVQDSFYKEIHNDVPAIICEMSEAVGLRLERRESFCFRQSRSRLNPHARRYREVGTVTEAVLCFKKSTIVGRSL